MRDQPTRASASLPENHPLYAPGLRRRPRANGEARYWLPLQGDIKNGWPLKSFTIPETATEPECAGLCRKHWGDLLEWRKGHGGPTRYSISWLIRRYACDEFSPYKKVRFNTKNTYDQDMAVIEKTVGARLIGPGMITGEDLWRWHHNWGKPDKGGNATAPSRARHAITMFRILIRHAVVIGIPGAGEIASALECMRFPTTAPRTVAPTREQVMAIVGKAMEMGFRSIALVTLAQFELVERRVSVIGAWEGQQWRYGWTWQNISPDWIIRYHQNKVGAVLREFDLKVTQELLSLLQQTPVEKRVGPVIICETTGLPWREKHYTDKWREIADAAGIPAEMYSMDMRAGGASEADELGVQRHHIMDAGGWKSDVVDRYRRAKHINAQNVVRLRQTARRNGGGTD